MVVCSPILRSTHIKMEHKLPIVMFTVAPQAEILKHIFQLQVLCILHTNSWLIMYSLGYCR